MSQFTRLWVTLAIFKLTCALTDYEVSLFANNGNYGGSVTTTAYTDYHRIQSNGLPDHEMERVNPNTATAQNYDFSFYKEGIIACTPGCLPMGIIGVTKTGVAIYNPLDMQGENAVEGPGAETFDSCQGHADNMGRYHYHKIPDVCGIYTGQVDEFIGVALDGFPIYGPNVSGRIELLRSVDLDICHGRYVNGRYQYHVTYDFPYFMACFKGTQTTFNTQRVSFECGSTGTHATEYGYVCGCSTSRPPPPSVDPVVCETSTTSTQTKVPTSTSVSATTGSQTPSTSVSQGVPTATTGSQTPSTSVSQGVPTATTGSQTPSTSVSQGVPTATTGSQTPSTSVSQGVPTATTVGQIESPSTAASLSFSTFAITAISLFSAAIFG